MSIDLMGLAQADLDYLRWKLGIYVFFRIGAEFLKASSAAEVVSLSRVLELELRPGGVHVHVADRIRLFETGLGYGRWLGSTKNNQARGAELCGS
jgi:hypothetical protein